MFQGNKFRQSAICTPHCSQTAFRVSRAELFQLTKSKLDWRENECEIGIIPRWLENIVVSVETEPEICDRRMNTAQARWQELVPEVTPADPVPHDHEGGGDAPLID